MRRNFPHEVHFDSLVCLVSLMLGSDDGCWWYDYGDVSMLLSIGGYTGMLLLQHIPVIVTADIMKHAGIFSRRIYSNSQWNDERENGKWGSNSEFITHDTASVPRSFILRQPSALRDSLLSAFYAKISHEKVPKFLGRASKRNCGLAHIHLPFPPCE